ASTTSISDSTPATSARKNSLNFKTRRGRLSPSCRTRSGKTTKVCGQCGSVSVILLITGSIRRRKRRSLFGAIPKRRMPFRRRVPHHEKQEKQRRKLVVRLHIVPRLSSEAPLCFVKRL